VALGGLPIIAEDLGAVTPEVEALRRAHDLPGMCVLQFAFAGAVEPRFLPHRHERNTVVYTGTHDNDTTRGWFAGASAAERERLERYLGQPCSEESVSGQLLRLAWGSVADLAVAPVQDVLSLGREARMNVPGEPVGNWRWRLRPGALGERELEALAELSSTFERGPPDAGA
jgi:4-alpha-glucanotransferase